MQTTGHIIPEKSKLVSNLTFMKRCKDKRVLPNCFKNNHPLNKIIAQNILKTSKEKLFRNEIK